MLPLSLLFLFPLLGAVLFGHNVAYNEMLSSATLTISFLESGRTMAVLCGGVIISPTTILTSKHCLYLNGNRATEVNVSLADYDRLLPDQNEFAFSTKTFFELSRSGHDINDDLAMVVSKKFFDVSGSHSPHIATIPSPSTRMDFSKQHRVESSVLALSDNELERALCYASGFGIDENNQYSRHPKRGFLRLFFSEEGYSQPVLTGRYLSEQTRFCQGDSGSPVFCWIRGTRCLIGLLSEIGGEAVPNFFGSPTPAEECSAQPQVSITDIRSKLYEIRSRSHP